MKVKVSLEDRRRGVESTKISGRDLKRHSSERKSGGGGARCVNIQARERVCAQRTFTDHRTIIGETAEEVSGL